MTINNINSVLDWLQILNSNDFKTISRWTNSLNIQVLSINDKYGEVIGSEGEVYHTTLGTCSCVDWTHRKDKEIPCKHQFALARAILEQFNPKETVTQIFANHGFDLQNLNAKQINYKTHSNHNKVISHSSPIINDGPFINMTFLFTGSLSSMKREEAQARVEALGGKAASGVSKTLSVLVATSNTSSKWKKAQDLNSKGANIQLWTEEDFLRELAKYGH